MGRLAVLLACLTVALDTLSAETRDPWYKKVVDAAAKKANLHDIRQIKGFDEIRVWILDDEPVCFVVRKYPTKRYEAIRVDVLKNKIRLSAVEHPPVPSFDRLWRQLEINHAFSLPDSATLKGGVRVLDGFDVLVQYAKGGIHGGYAYSNPLQQPWPEAKRVMKVAELVGTALREAKE